MNDTDIKKQRRPRDRACPRAGLSDTERDREILVTVFLCRAVIGAHVDPLFPSIKARNERLRSLFDHVYLVRSFPQQVPVGTPIYHIGKAGIPIAVATLAERGFDLTTPALQMLVKRPVAAQLMHCLRLSDVYTTCCLRAPAGVGVAVERFLPECLVRFEYELVYPGTSSWRPRCFAPDGALILKDGHGQLLVFLEIDLATVPLRQFAKKYRAFYEAVAGGLVSERFGMYRITLAVITVSETRLRQLARLVPTAKIPVVFMTFADIEQGGIVALWERLTAFAHCEEAPCSV